MNYDELSGEELARAVAERRGNPFRKPEHGSCCTCQTCGHYHDDCVCCVCEDIGEAWGLLGILYSQGWFVSVHLGDPNMPIEEYGPSVGLWHPDIEDSESFAPGKVAAEAICRAYLKATEG